ncbi:MAG: hypothetical protein DRR16_24135 [Candidatus Parabeggiatoa sp. nov. 3]|nr:MAG: hypothetical protein DRR00_06450 [Gammaproteobacteria bacterium]RKZ64629.1 MAG: hypothetical protein DRQ99_15200 [Gammaproteobacteria bacterium]RKZ80281.1 MAG: hypothetical protein DRR16_24135 [Gammaproteobacteria bacterium]
MPLKSVPLLGAAVHTRDVKPGQDYDWYVKAGDMQLFDKMAEIYRIALRDVEGDVPKLAVLIDGHRIGFLMSDLPSLRLDHTNRVIHDTLYLEFETQYQKTVLHAAAVLLLCSKKIYPIYEQQFADYAETLFYNSQATQLIFKTIKLPIVDKQPNFRLAPLKPEKLALFSDLENQNRSARYLIHFKRRNNIYFCFVSTGRVSLDRCQQIADKSDECVLLTLSSEVVSEMNLKKGRFSRFRDMIRI